MAVNKDPKADEVAETTVDLREVEGFHVVHDGALLGSYDTKEEAEAYAEAHPVAQGLKVSIVEGHAPADAE